MKPQPDGLIQRGRKFIRRRIVVNLAMLARRRNRHTTYIAITGSSAKSTSCALLAHILQPAAPTASRIFANTMPTIAPFMRRVTAEHEYAVIETAVDGLDRMRHLARLIRPHVAVITMIELEHKSQLHTRDVVAHEKGLLVEHLAPGGVAFLNADDEMTEGIARRALGKVIKFGRHNPADYQAVAVEARLPDCLSLRVTGPGLDLELQTRMFGEQFWLPVTVAVACANHLGVPADVITRQVASFAPPDERCTVMKLPGDRLVVLDTHKAPQHSLPLAFDMVRTASAGHKRIVLGQLSDTSGSSQSAYRKAYRQAREAADEVIFVGEHAHRHNASAEDVAGGRVREFGDVAEVADYLRETAVTGELVLLKSNSKLHLERAALAQVETVVCWARNCGLKSFCKNCEFYENPRQRQEAEQPA